jgi:hypothetical protein
MHLEVLVLLVLLVVLVVLQRIRRLMHLISISNFQRRVPLVGIYLQKRELRRGNGSYGAETYGAEYCCPKLTARNIVA